MAIEIQTMYAFVGGNQASDDEGILCVVVRDTPMPMVATELKSVEKLRPAAERCALQVGKPIKLVKFTQREIVEVIDGVRGPKKG